MTMKSRGLFLGAILVVVCVGCRLTDKDIEGYSQGAGRIAQGITRTIATPVDSYVPGASEGIAATVGAIVALASKTGLKLIQRRRTPAPYDSRSRNLADRREEADQ